MKQRKRTGLPCTWRNPRRSRRSSEATVQGSLRLGRAAVQASSSSRNPVRSRQQATGSSGSGRERDSGERGSARNSIGGDGESWRERRAWWRHWSSPPAKQDDVEQATIGDAGESCWLGVARTSEDGGNEQQLCSMQGSMERCRGSQRGEDAFAHLLDEAEAKVGYGAEEGGPAGRRHCWWK